MYPFFRAILFKLDPETAHGLTLNLVRLAGRVLPARWLLQALYAVPQKPVEVFGLKFMNPVGLAAGYDKDAIAVRGLAALGFGHLELGTVTPRPQPGNPKPRVFRLVEDEAVINRMGFPGDGMEPVAKSLRITLNGWRDRKVRIGVNLGKNKDTPLESAARDYTSLMRTFAPLADYLTINISSPNTVGLRRLQGREMLEVLLKQVSEERQAWDRNVPILVKLAPDLDEGELDDAIGVIVDTGMDGVIATNTTLARQGLRFRQQFEAGGLSGRPLTALSEAVLSRVVTRLDGRLPVISAGGIMSPKDAERRMAMGAALVQVYTGLVYAGPGLVKRIVRAM